MNGRRRDASAGAAEDSSSSMSDASPNLGETPNGNGNGNMVFDISNSMRLDAAKNTMHVVPLRNPLNMEGDGSVSSAGKIQHWSTKVVNNYRQKNRKEWLNTALPITKWLMIYKWKDFLLNDILAGLTVGVMIVPQGMSYAKLAGLPVQYGLYAAFLPVYAYALFGSSRQLAVGPVALLSLMLSTGLTHIIDPDNTGQEFTAEQKIQYQTLAVQTAFLVGVFYIVMGLLKLGFLTIFLSHAVVSGFTTGAAVIIGLSQIKYIVGYDVERSDVLHEVLHNIFKDIDQFSWKTFLMGFTGITLLVAMKHIGKTYPKLKWIRAAGPLTVTALSIIITHLFKLDQKGIAIVGDIPKGLPSPTLALWSPIEDINKLWTTVITMVIVGFMESIAIAKQLASKHKYELDSSMELIGLGVANLFGAMFSAYPVTGSFSRSAVNNESGAVSGVSAIVTATLVGFVLIFLTALFEKMPLAILASIVISGVLGLLDYPEAIHLYKVHGFDFLVWCISCFGTLFLGVEIGLSIAVGVSILLVTYESAYPHTAVLGRLPGTTVYRNIKQYPEAERYDGILICRIDAPIYFANTQYVREKMTKYELQTKDCRFVIMDLSPVSHIDTSGLHILQDIFTMYQARSVQLCLCNPNDVVMNRFILAGFEKEVGEDNIYVNTHDAVVECMREYEKKTTTYPDDDDLESPPSDDGRDDTAAVDTTT